MAVVPTAAPLGVERAPEVLAETPAIDARPIPVPRAVPVGTPVYTRRELAGRRHLDTLFRELYTAGLPELDSGTPLVVGVTSAIRGEGRTTTAMGLSLAITRDLDARVLLIELDLERPTLARELHLPTAPGLADVLHQDAPLEVAIRRLDACAIDVLPAGSVPHGVSRLLRSSALRELLACARSHYQVVVLDLPPALLSSDILPLSGLADAVLLVVRAGATPARLVEQTKARLGEGKVRGVILTAQRSRIPRWLRRLF